MANFNTHLAGGALVSGVFASATLSVGLVSISEATTLWLIGVLGGIMPDADSDHSHAVTAIFTGLAVLASFLVAHQFSHLALAYIWLAMLVTFIFIRFSVLWFFKTQTVHRGAFHSLLAAISLGLVCSCMSFYLFEAGANYAWGMGAMLSLGYLTHLILDEIYSVDLMGMNIKRSFGSAIKPIDKSSHLANALFLAAAVASVWWTPKPSRYPWTVFDSVNWQALFLG